MATSELEIPGVLAKDKTCETVVFGLIDFYNLEMYLQEVKDTIPSDVLNLWTRAFEALQKVHNYGFTIGRCEAKNLFQFKEQIMWADSTMFDHIAQSEPLVKNMKRLLDINRLLLGK